MHTKTSLIMMCLAVSACGSGGSGGNESGGETEPGTSTNPTTSTSTESSGSESSSESSASSSSGESSSEGGSESTGCPPVDPPLVPECATCELGEDCAFTCDFTACNTDCTDDACGIECVVCRDEQSCTETWGEGLCDPDGSCIEDATAEICEEGLQKGFEEDLTVQSGCSDMVVYAHSADDELGLSLFLDGLDVNSLEEETEFADIPFSDAQWLELRVGSDVTSAECTDVLEPPGPQIDELWVPTAGTIDVVITPSMAGVLADVTLENFVFEWNGTSVSMPSYTFTDVLVGWFPG